MTTMGQAVVDNTANAVKDVAKMTLSYLINDTPILTGQAKANWQVDVGTLAGLYGKYIRGSRTGFVNYQMALTQGMKAVDGRKPNQVINISNYLPYIGLLNAGSSKQAPANFIETAGEKARQHLAKLKVL